MIISQVTFQPIFIRFGMMAWWEYVGDIGINNAPLEGLLRSGSVAKILLKAVVMFSS